MSLSLDSDVHTLELFVVGRRVEFNTHLVVLPEGLGGETLGKALGIGQARQESLFVLEFGGESSPDHIVTIGHALDTVSTNIGMRFIGSHDHTFSRL